MNGKLNYFVTKHLEAVAELKARGFLVPKAIETGDEPLALSTREDITVFVAEHGCGDDAARLLGQAVAALVRTPKYIEALAADLSARTSIVTGKAVEPVSEMDRHSAALQLDAKAVRYAPKADTAPAKPKSPPPQPSKPPAPPPGKSPMAAQGPASPTAAAPSPSPFRNSGPLSDAEIERRRAALASLKSKAPA